MTTDKKLQIIDDELFNHLAYKYVHELGQYDSILATMANQGFSE